MKKRNNYICYGGSMKAPTAAGNLTFSGNMTGKMCGMLAIGTSAEIAPQCKARKQNKNLICAHCYTKYSLRYPQAKAAAEKNNEILTTHLLSKNEIPTILHPLNIARIEHSGETQNVLQAINYINIAKHNPQTLFALWTKNPGYYQTAFKTIPKPKNLIIIYSSIFINVEQYKILDRFPFVDKVFTVYSPEHLKAHPEIKINCGANNCLTCLRCYKKNTAKFIHEILK